MAEFVKRLRDRAYGLRGVVTLISHADGLPCRASLTLLLLGGPASLFWSATPLPPSLPPPIPGTGVNETIAERNNNAAPRVRWWWWWFEGDIAVSRGRHFSISVLLAHSLGFSPLSI